MKETFSVSASTIDGGTATKPNTGRARSYVRRPEHG